ncbi:ABC transporter permease/substrate-binding protein [Salicibibacter cibarius]|uniref:ABC transporter permease/substrate-binding protein n=1 Tax=Salicibibacter cibarius TaxID=2743000 RepID=A0A7T6Z356_9BACI|nr:ABC transporter permease/substrate-binding protein [Salicibibacter cibarius]QQK76138.1 ABC transporter permease/substrate-binding protein [Salicibibacter cibarius]
MTEAIQEFFTLFANQQEMLLELLWEHVQMSFISLLCAILIAVPLGIVLTRTRRLAEPVIGVAAVLQTIPSLALLGFMIIFFGIGTVPAIIALTVYALLPILRNTYTGISEIDPSIKEAATGMGMSPARRLRKVELPMAMPVVMAGIRTSMVLIIGTATLAALIGAGGLGDLIMTGIQRADQSYILLGAIPAAILALLFDFILWWTEKAKRSFMTFSIVMGAAFLIVITPAIVSTQQEDIVVGGKLDAEPEILANMYKHLIEQDTDLSVDVQAGLGGTDIVFDALLVGDIDIYPEFTGTAYVDLLGEDPSGMNEEDVYEATKEGIEEAYSVTYLEPMDYNNTYALAVSEAIGEEYELETVSDLELYQNELTAGFTFEFLDRPDDGYDAFVETYGFELADVNGLDPGLRSQAIEEGEVEVIDAYSTDAYLVEYEMIVLEDDEELFPPYQGAPLMREDVLHEHPELEGILNTLAGEISDEDMQEMNYLVDYEDADPEEVAKDYLQKNGLLQ